MYIKNACSLCSCFSIISDSYVHTETKQGLVEVSVQIANIQRILMLENKLQFSAEKKIFSYFSSKLRVWILANKKKQTNVNLCFTILEWGVRGYKFHGCVIMMNLPV